MHEKLDDLRTTDRSWKQSEVEVPPGHARHRRQRLPVKVILQHRRLSAKISFELIRVYLDTHDGDDIGGMCACFFSIVPRFSQTADIPGRAPIYGGRDTSSMADLYGSVRARMDRDLAHQSFAAQTWRFGAAGARPSDLDAAADGFCG